MRILKLLYRWAMKLSGNNPKLYYAWNLQIQYRVLRNRLQANSQIMKTTVKSKEAYEAYDDREQRNYDNESRLSWYSSRLGNMPFKESRAHYLAYLYEEIDRLIVPGKLLRILEVGCGNCINLVCLKEKYGDLIQLTGLELSPRRLQVAKDYFGERLSGVLFHIGSVTEHITEWKDGKFDLVYSMHCLEQIAYRCEDAVHQMSRLTNHMIVMIEPVFELGNPTQRLYLINSDHNRILLPTIKELGLNISRMEPLNIQSNPLNQSSIIVIQKQG